MHAALLVWLFPLPLVAQQGELSGAPRTKAEPEVVSLQLVSAGAAEKAGRFMASRTEMAPPGNDAKVKLPGSIRDVMLGTLTIDGGVAFAFGVRDDGPALIVDTNRNNDLSDDAAATLTPSKYGPEKQHTRTDGVFIVNIGERQEPYTCKWFRFDPADPQRTTLARTLHYYRDYGREGTLTLADKSYRVMLMDDRTTGAFDPKAPGAFVNMYIDVNNNSKFDGQGEVYDASQPFNIAGKVWELTDIAKDGGVLSVVPSDKRVEEVRPPLDHRVGGIATSFTGTTTDGKTVKFPEDYKGKLVLLDFWATWCQPCLAEMPNVVSAKQTFGGRGFVVLGISLDSRNAEKKVESTAQRLHMDWPSIYDGGHWSSHVPRMYEIASIPAAYLVDGDNGKILAMGRDVRGENLAATIERELKARGK